MKRATSAMPSATSAPTLILMAMKLELTQVTDIAESTARQVSRLICATISIVLRPMRRGVKVSNYHDVDGNPISLYKLVRKEPDWAASIIKFSNEKIPELEKRIAELEAQIPRWIPLTEKQPELDQVVIAWQQDGDVSKMGYDPYLFDEWCVTRWMPLPSAPGVGDGRTKTLPLLWRKSGLV